MPLYYRCDVVRRSCSFCTDRLYAQHASASVRVGALKQLSELLSSGGVSSDYAAHVLSTCLTLHTAAAPASDRSGSGSGSGGAVAPNLQPAASTLPAIDAASTRVLRHVLRL